VSLPIPSPRKCSRANIYRILRLRQLCSHPFLIQGPICDLLNQEDFEKLNGIITDEDENLEEGKNLLLHLRAMLAQKSDGKGVQGGVQGVVVSEDVAVPMDLIDAEGMEENTGGKFGEAIHFKKYLKSLAKSGRWVEIKERSVCAGCKQVRQERFIATDIANTLAAAKRSGDNFLLAHILPELSHRSPDLRGSQRT